MKRQYYTYKTSLGPITIQTKEDKLSVLAIGEHSIEHSEYIKNELLDKTYKQLEEYFAGKRKQFSLPLCPEGTEFQKKVWNELCNIPYGETRSYQEIATLIGNNRASRAVGMANHNNPIGIIIPCHRVIGKNGSLVGYAGGLEFKLRLLELEKKWK